MLIEAGFVRATASDGKEWTFTPSLARIAALGDPGEIVALFADLHGPRAAQTAAYVLAGLCDQEDATPLIGWVDEAGAHPGAMPATEQVIIARHLLQHGIVGKARPGRAGDGRYSAEFHASEYIAAACVHLGISRTEAEGLSMTELQTMFELKFPDKAKHCDVPTRDEYQALMARIKKGVSGV